MVVRSFDLVVIGAGVHGATVALAAQASGLRTALVTRGDLASGASGRVPLLLRRGASRSSMTGFVAGFGPHLLREVPMGDESLCLLDGPRYVVEAVVSALARGLVLETQAPVLGLDLEDRAIVRTAGASLSAPVVVFATGAADLDFLPEADRALAAGEIVHTESVRFDRAIGGGAYELAIDETRVLVVPLGQSTRVWAEGAGTDLAELVRARDPSFQGLRVLDTVSVARRRRDPPGHVEHQEHGGAESIVSLSCVPPSLAFDAARAIVEGVQKRVGQGDRRFATPLGETFAMSASAIAERYRLPEHAAARLISRRGSGAYDVLGRTDARPPEGAILCECEPVLECEARFAIEVERARSLEGLALRTDLGNGPCGGRACAHRAARLLSNACGLAPSAAYAEASGFLGKRRAADLSERNAADELNDARFCASGVVLES